MQIQLLKAKKYRFGITLPKGAYLELDDRFYTREDVEKGKGRLTAQPVGTVRPNLWFGVNRKDFKIVD